MAYAASMDTQPAARAPSATTVAIALATVYVVWGSTYLAIRYALAGFPPYLLGGFRFVIAGSVMLVFLRGRGEALPTRPQWRNAAIMGLLLLGLGNGLVNFAEQSVSSGLAAVAVAAAPIWMSLFARLRGDHPSRLEWLGVAIGFVGVVWLNAGSSLRASPYGLVALLVASLSWSFGSIWSRGRDLPSPFMTAAAQMLAAGIAMTLAGFAMGERVQHPSGVAIGAFFYLVVMGSLVGFTAYVWLLRHVRPALAGSYAYVNPAIAVMLGALVAGEHFSAYDLLPMAVILAGVVAMTVGKGLAKAGGSARAQQLRTAGAEPHQQQAAD